MNLLHPSRLRHSPIASLVILPDELITEVFSFLPVKSLMRLRSVSKSWKSLISDPTFVKLHLNRSSRKTDLTLVSSADPLGNKVLSFTICRLLENPPIIINLPNNDPYYQLNDKDCLFIVGSCNGLLCLVCRDDKLDTWLRFWNPATRTISGKLGGDYHYPHNCIGLKFVFGYDNSSDTYRVVNFFTPTTIVRVFNLGHNVWRNIPNSPVAMYHWMNVVHLTGSVIWVSIRNYNCGLGKYDCKIITIKQFLIISLDLGTEKYTQMRPPQGFDQVPFLMQSLIINHYNG